MYNLVFRGINRTINTSVQCVVVTTTRQPPVAFDHQHEEDAVTKTKLPDVSSACLVSDCVLLLRKFKRCARYLYYDYCIQFIARYKNN